MKMNKEVCSFMNTISYIMRSDEYYLLHVSKKDDVSVFGKNIFVKRRKRLKKQPEFYPLGIIIKIIV